MCHIGIEILSISFGVIQLGMHKTFQDRYRVGLWVTYIQKFEFRVGPGPDRKIRSDPGWTRYLFNQLIFIFNF